MFFKYFSLIYSKCFVGFFALTEILKKKKKIFKQKIVYVVLNMCHNYDKFFSKHLFMLALTVFVIADDRFIR